jgi:hypothetical protein
MAKQIVVTASHIFENDDISVEYATASFTNE